MSENDPAQRWLPPAGASSGPRWLPPTDGPGTLPPSVAPSPSGAPAPSAAPPPAGANGTATTALVLGIVGIVVLPLLPSIAAIVLGYRARREIDASHGRQTNRGMATAGIITGWIGVVWGLLVVLALIGIAGEAPEEGDGRSVGQPAFAALAVLGLG